TDDSCATDSARGDGQTCAICSRGLRGAAGLTVRGIAAAACNVAAESVDAAQGRALRVQRTGGPACIQGDRLKGAVGAGHGAGRTALIDRADLCTGADAAESIPNRRA